MYIISLQNQSLNSFFQLLIDDFNPWQYMYLQLQYQLAIGVLTCILVDGLSTYVYTGYPCGGSFDDSFAFGV